MATTAKSRIQLLELCDITVDMEIQQRVSGLDGALVNEYAEAIQRGAEFPPGRVFHVEWRTGAQDYFLSRGFHRFFAHQKAGREGIRVEVIKGSRNDAVVDACGANAEHGARRTNEDKRKAVATLHSMFPKKSTRAIAEMAKVSHEMVAEYRKQLSDSDNSRQRGADSQSDGDASDAPAKSNGSGKVTGTDGKEYNSRKPPIKESSPAAVAITKVIGGIIYASEQVENTYGGIGKALDDCKASPEQRQVVLNCIQEARKRFQRWEKELTK